MISCPHINNADEAGAPPHPKLRWTGRQRTTAPLAAWVCLLIFSGYSIATIHDFFVETRPRAVAVKRPENSGVPRRSFSANFVSDGGAQLESFGHAVGVRYEDFSPQDWATGFRLRYWSHFPDLRPDFVILNWTCPQHPPQDHLAVAFRTWLRPFYGYVFVWRRADLTSELQVARIFSAIPFGILR